jgi:hypothetical protein
MAQERRRRTVSSDIRRSRDIRDNRDTRSSRDPGEVRAERRGRRASTRSRVPLVAASALAVGAGALGTLWLVNGSGDTASAVRGANDSAGGKHRTRKHSERPSASSSATAEDRIKEVEIHGDSHGGGSRPGASGFPQSGPGTFVADRSDGGRIGGSGRELRYQVVVESNLAGKHTPAATAAEVRRILSDKRGWTANGEQSFRQVASGKHDFVIRLATPKSVDRICGRYGLDTGGEVNCRVGKDVVVNVKRWLLATRFYPDPEDLPDYRALIINHEVGHFLGRKHQGCPGEGRPAPVMMQQIKGLKGCVANAWPHDRQGRALGGPAES